jgi:hypothetical protein
MGDQHLSCRSGALQTAPQAAEQGSTTTTTEGGLRWPDQRRAASETASLTTSLASPLLEGFALPGSGVMTEGGEGCRRGSSIAAGAGELPDCAIDDGCDERYLQSAR